VMLHRDESRAPVARFVIYAAAYSCPVAPSTA
jgi:hypothetical protein